MNRRGSIIALAGSLVAGAWIFSEGILFSMNWTDMGLDGPDITENLRSDIAAGRTGLRDKGIPCVKSQLSLDLSLYLQGHVPTARDVVMRIDVSSSQSLIDQIYLGPPTPTVYANAVPICLDSPDPLTDDDEAAFAYVTVAFYDLANNRFQSFSSEDAFPIFAWQDVSVDLLGIPEESRSQGVTRIRVTPNK